VAGAVRLVVMRSASTAELGQVKYELGYTKHLAYGVCMRPYRHYCAVAKALDAIGERWSLLVVRELLAGPKRYTDLQAGLPGIATDILATRLRDLEKAGILARGTLAPPAASTVYELTPFGAGLGPAITELARWGMQLLGERDADDAFRSHWFAMPLSTMFRPDRAAGTTLTVQFETDDGTLHARVEDRDLRVLPGPADAADVVVRADVDTLAAVVREPATAAAATAAGRLTVTGQRDAVRRFAAAFGLGRTPTRAGAGGGDG
jgi:DNA-binding HxlR family transcriptional regulator/putative sterol carrier protein